jgi:hypothetical protein
MNNLLLVASFACSQSTEPEKKREADVPIYIRSDRQGEGSAGDPGAEGRNGWEREKARRALREMERAARPYQSIHPGVRARGTTRCLPQAGRLVASRQ